MSFEIIEVGYYDNDDVFFIIEPCNGFEANSTELANGVAQYIVRIATPNGYKDVPVSPEEAIAIINIYHRTFKDTD